ncbi:hypothetical protein PoB_001618300 [Plakobranchus ocellatus]|uniref:Uncharacterized protein n=1 Tax=Plakobranchus ocellatus TaxID=259542 RepID=A0AAV3Z5F2_9GAST|nr:hypothetical protein PoB_001618300 [Plakobranchus ocellatus]
MGFSQNTTMGKQESTQAEHGGIKESAMSISVLIMSLFLLATSCLAQDNNSLPLMRFGNFFHVTFPNNTLHRFYECLCDIKIIQCCLIYKIRDDVAVFELSYPFTVIKLQHLRASSNSSTLYKNVFKCDTLDYTARDSVNCYRQTANDNTCERNKNCLTYSVPLNYTTCSYHCTQLVWPNAFGFPITFENFGEFPTPLENEKCFASDVPRSTQASTKRNNSTSFFSDDTSTPNSTKENNRDSSPFPIPIAAGVGSCLVIMSVAAFVMHRIKHRKQKVKYRTETNTSAPILGTSTIDNSNNTYLPQDPSSSGEPEEVRYQTLDEVTGDSRDEQTAAGCDNDGYSVIQDCTTECQGEENRMERVFTGCQQEEKRMERAFTGCQQEETRMERAITECQQEKNRMERACRPLPAPPSAGIIASAIPNSIVPSHPPSSPVELNQSLSDIKSQPLSIRPNPTPHRGRTDPKKNKEMGLVNIQGDHPAFKGHTHVKLVRTEWGEMELISLEDEPVFSDYYSRLQLISLKDSAVGVIGLTNSHTDTNFFDIFKITEAEKTNHLRHTPNRSNFENIDHKPSASSHAKEIPNPYVDIVFIGPLEMVRDVGFGPCDYMKVLDIDPGLNASTDSGYLTVLDIDPATDKLSFNK